MKGIKSTYLANSLGRPIEQAMISATQDHGQTQLHETYLLQLGVMQHTP